ncbi:LOW QUALITY PROTEIN: rho-related GTP-binding protein RhoF [Vombatus ursinus]|uniref:LOW QUALITY PROTEIN: rho-related GTP-binding protein RhoF n=1 Tax=Vombatus ursinus TaxID=29139 RepID=UPI000FFCE9DB|nr:LOW QUALITY PROTEIN: rho-related GTP-binding protein RhoF [Vombatus ursinus]
MTLVVFPPSTPPPIPSQDAQKLGAHLDTWDTPKQAEPARGKSDPGGLSSQPARPGPRRRRSMADPAPPAPAAAPTPAQAPGKKELKIVIVGDGGCGKTSLLMVYSQGAFPEHYAPSVFEKYTTSVTLGSKEVVLNLYDTAGQEDYDRLRPLSYQNTHLVLICYDVMNPTSYDNVLIKWYPEVTHFCHGTPMVLIGCKTDLRKDKEQLRKLRAADLEPITYAQGESACQQMKAALYLECSAKFRENVEDVFREATKVALSALKKAQRKKKRHICLLL